MELIPRDFGIYAKCDCGSRMFIPTESALKNSVVFCPCGEITKVGNDLLNKATRRRIHSHVAKETGRLYRLPVKERKQSQIPFEPIG